MSAYLTALWHLAPWLAFAAAVLLVLCRAESDTPCQLCAEHARCDRCDDRMCSEFGPEPQPGCGLTCIDCPPCDCTPCWDARIDAEMEAAYQAERDARAS